jgi:DNA-binding GntR family transcriptional regulator
VGRAGTSTSAGRAAAAVRELILRGEFVPGDRLGEAELAERLGMSRTPIREALSRLAAEGLVETTPNRGSRVTSWTVEELADVFHLRSTIEPRLTSLAAAAATTAEIDELGAMAERMVVVGSPGPDQDLDSLVPLNRDFHERLVTIAAAPALAVALAGAVRAPIVLRNFHTYDVASLRRSLGHHLEIVAAMRAEDPEWAGAVMAAHIRNARAVMVRAARDAAAHAARQPQEETR